MNNRLIVSLVVITALVAGAAVMSLRRPDAHVRTGESLTSGPFLGDLSAHVNDAARVTITTSQGAFTVEKGDEGWGLQDKGGYPVDFNKVKAVVVGLSELEVAEEKTSNPEYYAKLGVEEIGPDAASKRITIADGAGTVLADVLVGNARTSRGGGVGGSSLYVRREGAPTSYEVRGAVQVDGQATNWLDKQIIKLEAQRVRQVVIRHPDGEVLTVAKQEEGDAHFAVQDPPADRELIWEGVADSVGGALAWLSLEDVGPDLVDFDQQAATVAEFTCFDGYVVTVETVEVDGKTYLRLHGALDESQRADAEIVGPEPAEPEPQAEAEAPEGDEAAADSEETEEPEDQGKTADEVRAEAEALNEKVGAWIYEIPGYRATNLRKRMAELLKPLESEEPEPAAEEPDAAPSGLPPEVLKQLQEQGVLDASGAVIAPPGGEGTEAQTPPEAEPPAASPPAATEDPGRGEVGSEGGAEVGSGGGTSPPAEPPR